MFAVGEDLLVKFWRKDAEVGQAFVTHHLILSKDKQTSKLDVYPLRRTKKKQLRKKA